MRCLTLRQIAAVTIAGFGIAACTDNSTPEATSPNEESRLIVALSVETDTIPESLSKSISARVTDQTGALKLAPVTWKSSNASVASVSAGTITGVSAGTAMIIASVGSGADSALIVVTPKEFLLDVQPSAAAIAVMPNWMFFMGSPRGFGSGASEGEYHTAPMAAKSKLTSAKGSTSPGY